MAQQSNNNKNGLQRAQSGTASAGQLSLTEGIAIALGVVWLIGTSIFFLRSSGSDGSGAGVDSLRFVMTLMSIFLPVALIWVAATAARASRTMREDSRRLQVAIDALRQTYVSDRQTGNQGAIQPSVERKLAEIAQSARQTETTLATFASHRKASAPTPVTAASIPTSDQDQPSLELGTQAEDNAPVLSSKDLIRALNFPDTAEDEAGFAALRRALKDRTAKQLVQASQDVLTLISQDGIYMDDLRPDRARPEIWRRFAKGERGRTIAALGGVRDRSSLALTAGRMREDMIFRDTAHHFLRNFDHMLVSFEEVASDEEIIALSETRTARAFMLLGRVTGAFS